MFILILVDYRSQLYSSTYFRGASLNIESIRTEFEHLGYTVFVRNFAEIQFDKTDYYGTYVVYQSSEDPSLAYKDYIEDILFCLVLRGAILIPDLLKFRAHHNKVCMEGLRQFHPDRGCRALSSQCFGTFEDYRRFFNPKSFPVVMKASFGSKSRNVFLAYNQHEADKYARKLSHTFTIFNVAMTLRNLRDGLGFVPVSVNRRKFVVQQFVPGLVGDYKIVVYGNKYYVLYRANRPHDFRASGSGKLSFPEHVAEVLLNYSQRIFSGFDVPYISMDIGYNGKQCFLFEFQFLMFGQYAIEQSPWYFSFIDGQWIKVESSSEVERELVAAVDSYIRKVG